MDMESSRGLLFEAVGTGQLDIVRNLLQNRELVEAMDKNGETSLHVACCLNDVQMVQVLLENGANYEVKNRFGQSSFEIAWNLGHDSIIKLFYYNYTKNTSHAQWKRFPLTQQLEEKANFKLSENDLGKSVNTNSAVEYKNNILHFYAAINNEEGTKILVETGVSVDCKNSYGQTPLHIAIDRCFDSLATFLLSRMAYVDLQDLNGDSPLHYAAQTDNVIMIENLTRKRAILDLANKNGFTPFHISIFERCHKAFYKLLNEGADINAKDKKGQTSLHISVYKGVLSIISKLVNEGANLEARDIYGRTPIHIAAKHRRVEVLKYLYYSGSEITTSSSGQTLLHIAVKYCNFEGLSDDEKDEELCELKKTINWLLFMGVDVNSQDTNGETALHYAVRWCSVSVLSLLLEKGISRELKNQDGQTALHLAASRNWIAFNYLLGEAADPCSKDKKGMTPLQTLSWNYYTPLKNKHFSEREVPPNFKEDKFELSEGVKPMIHHFLSLRLHNIIKFLLKESSDIETRYNGETPLLYAAQRGLTTGTSLLLNLGANINAANRSCTLHIAVSKDFFEIALRLILHGADVNAKDHCGRTPLHILLKKNYINQRLLENLLNKGARIDAVDFRRKTPIDYMSAKNMNRSVKYLLRNNIILLKTVNMLDVPVEFKCDGGKQFHEICLEEVKHMKNNKCGKYSLYDVFKSYGNPTYIFSKTVRMKLKDTHYPIYHSLLQHTFERAKVRYQLLNSAQDFFTSFKKSVFQTSLPVEIQRRILYYLTDEDLQNLIKIAAN